MDETGECGVLWVDTDSLPVSPRFIKTAKRTVHRLPVPLPDGGGASATEGAIRKAIEKIPADDLVRVELTGRRPIDSAAPDTARLTALFERGFYYFEVKDTTRLDVRPEDYAGSLTLKGMLVDLLSATGMDEERRDEILTAALAALRGEEDDL